MIVAHCAVGDKYNGFVWTVAASGKDDYWKDNTILFYQKYQNELENRAKVCLVRNAILCKSHEPSLIKLNRIGIISIESKYQFSS